MNNRGKGALMFASALAITLSFAGGPIAKAAYADSAEPAFEQADGESGATADADETEMSGDTNETPSDGEQNPSNPNQDFTTPPMDLFGGGDKEDKGDQGDKGDQKENKYDLKIDVEGEKNFVVGNSGQFVLTIDGVAPNKSQLKKVEWASSDEGIMTVGEDGKYTCIGAGDVEITASYKGSTAVWSIHVKDQKVDIKRAVAFDGVKFTYSLDMKKLDANGNDPTKYVVESWMSDKPQGDADADFVDTENPTYKVESPTAVESDQVCAREITLNDLGKYAHYRVSYPGYSNPNDGTEFVYRFDGQVADFFGKGSTEDTGSVKNVAMYAWYYNVVMNEYFYGKDNDVVRHGYIKMAKASTKTTVVPEEYKAKVTNDSTLIAGTKSHIEFGDTAKIKYVFTPDPGILAHNLEFTVDGQAVVASKKVVNEATGATITLTEQKDHTMLLVIAGIKPADMDHSFVVTAGRGENNIKTIDCSVNSFLYSLQNEKGAGIICKALYNYYNAANAYCNKADGVVTIS